MDRPTIEETKKKFQKQIMAIRGVVGLGIALENGDEVIKVMVAKHTKAIDQKIPKDLDGYRVVISETGIIRAF
ncbi:MAG: hypothetical protein ACOY90_12940 [Candidatus Zhuqueibacterota bacterium]